MLKIKRKKETTASLAFFRTLVPLGVSLLALPLLSSSTTAYTKTESKDKEKEQKEGIYQGWDLEESLERIKLKGEIARLEIQEKRGLEEIENLKKKFSIAPQYEIKNVNAKVVEFERSLENLKFTIKNYITLQKSLIDEWGFETFKNSFIEEKISFYLTLGLEVALYVIGFKWFWGLFTGYKPTFITDSARKLSRFYAANVDRDQNTVTRNLSPKTAEKLDDLRAEIDKNLLSLETSLAKFEMDLLGSGKEIEFSKEKAMIREYIKNISKVILNKEEGKLSRIDFIRGQIENLTKYLRYENERIVLNQENLEEEFANKIIKVSGEYADTLEEQIEVFKQLDTALRISNMDFREASSPLISLINISRGFKDIDSFQERDLSEFRNWKLQARYTAIQLEKTLKANEKILKKKIYELNVLIQESAALKPKDQSPVLLIKTIISNLHDAEKTLKELLKAANENNVNNIYENIYDEISDEIDARLKQTKLIIEEEVKGNLKASRRISLLEERNQQINKQLKEKRERFDELWEKVSPILKR